MRYERKKQFIPMLFLLLIVLVLLLSVVFTTSVFAVSGVTTLTGSSSTYAKTLMSGKYAIDSDVTFSGGLRIPSEETVYIDIPAGTTLTCNGRNASISTLSNGFGTYYDICTESTAGITVEDGATLYLTGDGNLVVKGGDGTQAQAGYSGTPYTITFSYIPWFFKNNVCFWGGSGGTGGTGAFAPSAAIGGNGGVGGKRTNTVGAPTSMIDENEDRVRQNANSGYGGNNGSSGGKMGNVFICGSLDVTATAGTNYPNSAVGGTFQSYVNYKNGGENNSWYVYATTGAPGGGGGGSTAAAIIGGGGAGGGSGGVGASGGIAASKYASGTIPNNDIASTHSNATAGSGVNGGKGGVSDIPSHDGSGTDYSVVGGNGGIGGTSGLGGNLYLSEGTTVNGVLATELNQTDLGAVTNETSGQGANVKLLARVEVSMFLDGDAYVNRAVSVRNNSVGIISLEESEVALGHYFGYVPVGSGDIAYYVDGVNTNYLFSVPDTTLIQQILQFHACEVDVSLDDGDYGSKGEHKVTLMRNSIILAELTEETTGVFKANLVEDKNGNNTYEVYIDGVNYGKTLTVENGVNKKVDAPFYTLTVETKLHDGLSTENYGGQTVSIYKGGCYITRMIETATLGIYQAVVPGEDSFGIISYTVGIGENRSANTIQAETGATKIVDYYNVAVTLKDGTSNWSGQTVSLICDGKVKNMIEIGSTGVYKTIIFGEDTTEYNVVIDGIASTNVIQATNSQKREVIVNFFTATVKLLKNNSVWTDGVSVILKKDGNTAYILENSGDKFIKEGISEGEYEVYVYGINSEANTGIVISDGSIKEIDFFTVTYHKNVGSSISGDKVQIYQKNTTPNIASAPYEAGYTFKSWKVSSESNSEDYEPTSITEKTDVYACWVSPKLALSGYIRCDENGNVASSGEYFKFLNLAIEGYPIGNEVINTMTITLENVKLTTTNPPSGWENVGTWDNISGNGKYIFKLDTGEKLTVAEAQDYLRELVFQRNNEDGMCSVQMSIYGDTSAQ